ncbi:hypothetical protein NCAS_0E00720 [Naumovozyma castellii]|uniref:Vacuolar protein sorting-associated protein 62 n=1 Tax=Naumovozyma castellii TaxID=27288 RepID=G0VF77_NAUCA|nr:hypothetical protein NCAS_0E00720 [Naumovozyma castellii CBS 4309]CCC70142.1 hypothetical protein NCAS_0E00720 [Naumovozyma castellii CBS 4309]
MIVLQRGEQRTVVALFLFLLFIYPNNAYGLVPWLDNDPFVEMEPFTTSNDKGQTFQDITELPPILPPWEINDDNRSLKEDEPIPQYIIDNCPLIHLYSEERYWPSDIKDYVTHFHLEDDSRTTFLKNLTLANLPRQWPKNESVTLQPNSSSFMTSNTDFAKDPKWVLGEQPEYGTGLIKSAPAVLIIVDKGNGWVDAYWFYFYPFNWGPYIMGYGPWGNHMGDWEHSLVRFYKGEPKFLWMSAHGGGSAYQFTAIEKVKKLKRVDGKLTNEVIKRPLLFSARGTHANYASVGQHSHDVPFFFMPLSDFTDRGPMWDPALNFYGYVYNGTHAMAKNKKSMEVGTDWLFFDGKWGDRQLPARDPRQKWCPAQWKYIDGPTGPLFKHLDRISLCPSFKWWNFWKGCPARRLIKKGEGLDAEKNDLMGDNCGVLLYWVRPKWLRGLLRFLTWRGTLCFVMDYFTG